MYKAFSVEILAWLLYHYSVPNPDPTYFNSNNLKSLFCIWHTMEIFPTRFLGRNANTVACINVLRLEFSL